MILKVDLKGNTKISHPLKGREHMLTYEVEPIYNSDIWQRTGI